MQKLSQRQIVSESGRRGMRVAGAPRRLLPEWPARSGRRRTRVAGAERIVAGAAPAWPAEKNTEFMYEILEFIWRNVTLDKQSYENKFRLLMKFRLLN